MVVTASVLALSGCSSDEGPRQDRSSGEFKPHTGPEPQLGAVSTPKSFRDVMLPLDAYLSSPQQRALVSRAEDVRVRECMAGFGFDMPVVDRTAAAAMPWPSPGRFMLFDAEAAARYGYKPSPDEHPKSGKQQQPELSDAAMTVYSGQGPSRINGTAVPKGGCIGKVRSEFSGGAEVLATPNAQKFTLFAYEWSLQDSRVIEVFARWSTCMRDAGYDYATPRDVNNDPAWSSGAGSPGGENAIPPASDREITVAKTDVTCKLQTNLVGTWSAVASAYQNELIEKNAETLQNEKNALENLLAQASK